MLPATIQCAYVTGGSSGIGFAIAAELVRRNVSVLLIARDRGRLEQAARALREGGGNGSRVGVLSMDVGNAALVKELLPNAVTEFGEPDLLVNCAGEAYPEYFERLPDAVFEQTIDVHLKGTWYVTKTLVPYLKKRRGIVVNVSSLAGLVGVFGYTAYSSAKAGIIGFSEALRSELSADGVQVFVLCPPDTDTPGFQRENRTKPLETKVISANAGVLPPSKVARELFRGMEKDKFLIVPGMEARFTVWVARHFPGVVRWVMDRSVRSCRRKIQSSRS